MYKRALAIAFLFAATISFDPRTVLRFDEPDDDDEVARFVPPPQAEPVTPPPQFAAVYRTPEPVPADVKVVVTKSYDGYRVTLERPRHIVALRGPNVRALGVGAAKLYVAMHDVTGYKPRLETLTWETTPIDLDVRSTDDPPLARGLLDLDVDDADKLATELHMTNAAQKRDTLSAQRYRCASYEDGTTGFIVLCAIKGRNVSAANVSGAHPLEDVIVADGPKSSVVRLDLPVTGGQEQARMIGFVDGLLGTEIRAEGSYEGRDPAPVILLGAAERLQPTAAF